jgi:hypothetical protein
VIRAKLPRIGRTGAVRVTGQALTQTGCRPACAGPSGELLDPALEFAAFRPLTMIEIRRNVMFLSDFEL